jgi:hypothetical protein
MLVRFGGILDGQGMQIELPLHPLQKIVTWFVQADPNDVTGPFRPLTGLLDWDVGEFPAAGIYGRIDNARLVVRSRNFSFGQHGRTSKQEAALVARYG